jgi:hypothetical protein
MLTIDIPGQEVTSEIEVEEVRRRLLAGTLDRNARVLVSRSTSQPLEQPIARHPAGDGDTSSDDSQLTTSTSVESSVWAPIQDFAKRHYRIDVLFEPVKAHARQGSRLGGWILGTAGAVLPIVILGDMLIHNEPMPSSVWVWLTFIIVLIAALLMTVVVVTTNVTARRVFVVGSLRGILPIALVLAAIGYFVIGPYGFVALVPISVTMGIACYGSIGWAIGWGLGLVVGAARRPWLPRLRSVI